jgi:hypothetical protein
MKYFNLFFFDNNQDSTTATGVAQATAGDHQISD